MRRKRVLRECSDLLKIYTSEDTVIRFYLTQKMIDCLTAAIQSPDTFRSHSSGFLMCKLFVLLHTSQNFHSKMSL